MRFFAALRMTGRGIRPAGDGGCGASRTPPPTDSKLVRKQIGGRFVNRPDGVDAGAGRNIAGLMARNAGATLAVAREGRKARFFAALRMTGTRGAAGGAEPRPYGSILVRKKTGGRFVNRPYGVDAGAGRNIAGLMARNVGATLAVTRIDGGRDSSLRSE